MVINFIKSEREVIFIKEVMQALVPVVNGNNCSHDQMVTALSQAMSSSGILNKRGKPALGF